MVHLKKVGPRPILLFVFKSSVFLTIIIFIYLKFRKKSDLVDDFVRALYALGSSTPWWVWVLLGALMPLNWWLEAVKWQHLAKKVAPITRKEALAGVLAGLSLSFITPHALGDYAARIWHSDNDGRAGLLGAVLLGRLLQLMATLLFGLLGVYYVFRLEFGTWVLYSYFLGGVLVVLCTSLFLRKQLLKVPKSRYTWLKKHYRYIAVLTTYGPKDLAVPLLLAMLRYLVFSVQFLWVLQLFGIALPWQVLYAGVTWTLLAKSVLPTFNFLSDLGVREFSALYFFANYGVDEVKLLMATLFIWLLNILLPTLAGIFYVFRMKVVKTK